MAQMNVQTTKIPGVLLIEPKVIADSRGFFMESFQKDRYYQAGVREAFVQDNHSCSRQGILRGLHYQIQHPQGKLVWVIRGEVFDVAVDLRKRSPTFGQWVGAYLNDTNRRQLYLPPGLAHGFCVMSEIAEFVYKCTDYYHPEFDRTLLWNDPQVAVDWPVREPILSEKDQRGRPLAAAEVFEDLSVAL
jgi:dTDP-4-dehydrorhamnose 3,5-epimerase